MPATKLEVKEWFDDGVKHTATYMIVVVDGFDHRDYPVYVLANDNIHDKLNQIRMSPMQRIVEIYDLSMDRTMQLNEHRAIHFPPFPTKTVEAPAKK